LDEADEVLHDGEGPRARLVVEVGGVFRQVVQRLLLQIFERDDAVGSCTLGLAGAAERCLIPAPRPVPGHRTTTRPLARPSLLQIFERDDAVGSCTVGLASAAERCLLHALRPVPGHRTTSSPLTRPSLVTPTMTPGEPVTPLAWRHQVLSASRAGVWMNVLTDFTCSPLGSVRVQPCSSTSSW